MNSTATGFSTKVPRILAYLCLLLLSYGTLVSCVATLAPKAEVSKETLLISSQGIVGSAVAGKNELSEYNDAQIVLYIQALDSGAPETKLAPPKHTGDSRSKIDLPAGWTLTTPIVPGGGCMLQPVHLYNPESGMYTLSVMTMSVYGPCSWLSGEYAYSLSIQTEEYSGGTVGKIVIP